MFKVICLVVIVAVIIELNSVDGKSNENYCNSDNILSNLLIWGFSVGKIYFFLWNHEQLDSDGIDNQDNRSKILKKSILLLRERKKQIHHQSKKFINMVHVVNDYKYFNSII